MNLDDLRPLLKDMTDEQLMEMILKTRMSRRTPVRAPSTRISVGEAKAPRTKKIVKSAEEELADLKKLLGME